MHETFKIQRRHNLDKDTNRIKKANKVWQNTFVVQSISKNQINTWLIQQSSTSELSKNHWAKRWNKNTHAQRLISFKQIKLVRRNEITHSQKSKVSTNKPNSLHFSQWHKVPKEKVLSSNKTHLIGIKRFSKGKEDKGRYNNFLEIKISQ